ncbi:MAG: iron ABC transporter permease [Bacillaceae bacterium]|jgi:ABC-type Fe3+-siderophore transport system, permease component|uniref:Probable heme-iron transport system permease protein IsdF n=2 Tax=Aeribacillus TaxID=1055323 RepID=A0A161W3M5_9BACI|nr:MULTISPECIES: iron ABC transporter permease [Aeribacillus]AXI38330.1 iron ABC transporter permease [Bacillaceae bacterium ZC4]REJ11949.1 MAG: iron ABC transporter permease [Bacillaceae bacterium]KZM54567.1 ABC transporter permease [Aeribacillus pallidus]KZN96606.1 ABC transporter permease [Aeribacillus pallidus]MED0651360.1 iron ABC transporter permease [Aeribacillus composti]
MKKTWLTFAVVTTMLVVVTFFSIVNGSLEIGVAELIRGLLFGGNEDVEVIKDMRFPRIIVSLFAGANLAVSGLLLQAVMRNPLAEAGIIGISSGANFVALTMISFFPTLFFWMPLFAFLGGILACFLVYSFSWKSGLSPLRLILVGVAVNAVFTALYESFNYRGYTTTSSAKATASTLSQQTWDDVQTIVIYGSIGLILSLLVYSWCNMLALQDKTARNLGLHVTRARVIISAIAVYLASVTTATVGVIAFVGLLIPHIGRLLVGSDYKILTPFSILSGALLILTADTIGRVFLAPTELPASIIMSLIGGPFLIILIRRSDRIYGG